MKDRIRQLMETQHMNQQAFARFTKIGSASLSSIFTGRTNPSMNQAKAIMEAFPNVNPKWLILGDGPMMIGDAPSNTSRHEALQNQNDCQNDTERVPQTQKAVRMTSSPYNQNTPSGSYARDASQGSMGGLFNENSFYDEEPLITSPASTNQNQMHESTSVYQSAPASYKTRNQRTDNLAVNKQPNSIQIGTAKGRRITEIRVFYEDQTWESFVPKNK